MSWDKFLKIAENAGIITAVLVAGITAVKVLSGIGRWIRERIVKTMNESCQNRQLECQAKICARLDRMEAKREDDKAEAIERREEMEVKLFEALKENRRLIDSHYNETKEFMGEVKGMLSLLVRKANGGK